jgi:hypothetical protein
MAGNKGFWGKVWYFVWHSNSIWSWVANIIIAFVLIKFLVYPGLGLIMGTTHPIVAVVSESMDHRMLHPCKSYDLSGTKCLQVDSTKWALCPTTFTKKSSVDFDFYWENCGKWYETRHNISQEQFEDFPFMSGFKRGDIIVLHGKKPADIKVGEVIVFKANKEYPIIHRVVAKRLLGGEWYFTTKGDHNQDSIDDAVIAEVKISEDRVLGVSWFKIPFLGYIKIKFVDFMSFLVGKDIGG